MSTSASWRRSTCEFLVVVVYTPAKSSTSSRQIDRNQKTLARHEQQRTRDAEMLRTVTENLERALYTNESITADMQRETVALQKEEDDIRVRRPADHCLCALRASHLR